MEQNNEFSVQLNAHQLELFVNYGAEIINYSRQIKKLQEERKEAIAAMFEAMGVDGKEMMEARKELKASLTLAANDNADEKERLVVNAAQLARKIK